MHLPWLSILHTSFSDEPSHPPIKKINSLMEASPSVAFVTTLCVAQACASRGDHGAVFSCFHVPMENA
jgi:hypothetical protein